MNPIEYPSSMFTETDTTPLRTILEELRGLLASPSRKRPACYVVSPADYDRLCAESSHVESVTARRGSLLVYGVRVVESAHVPEGTRPVPVFEGDPRPDAMRREGAGL